MNGTKKTTTINEQQVVLQQLVKGTEEGKDHVQYYDNCSGQLGFSSSGAHRGAADAASGRNTKADIEQPKSSSKTMCQQHHTLMSINQHHLGVEQNQQQQQLRVTLESMTFSPQAATRKMHQYSTQTNLRLQQAAPSLPPLPMGYMRPQQPQQQQHVPLGNVELHNHNQQQHTATNAHLQYQSARAGLGQCGKVSGDFRALAEEKSPLMEQQEQVAMITASPSWHSNAAQQRLYLDEERHDSFWAPHAGQLGSAHEQYSNNFIQQQEGSNVLINGMQEQGVQPQQPVATMLGVSPPPPGGALALAASMGVGVSAACAVPQQQQPSPAVLRPRVNSISATREIRAPEGFGCAAAPAPPAAPQCSPPTGEFAVTRSMSFSSPSAGPRLVYGLQEQQRLPLVRRSSPLQPTAEPQQQLFGAATTTTALANTAPTQFLIYQRAPPPAAPSSLSSVCSSAGSPAPASHQSFSVSPRSTPTTSPPLTTVSTSMLASQKHPHHHSRLSPNGHYHHDSFALGINLEQYISKRNERERSRVRNVNDAFDNLKNSLPLDMEKLSKRMSKVEILRTAINYIKSLEEVLGCKEQQQQQAQQQKSQHNHRAAIQSDHKLAVQRQQQQLSFRAPKRRDSFSADTQRPMKRHEDSSDFQLASGQLIHYATSAGCQPPTRRTLSQEAPMDMQQNLIQQRNLLDLDQNYALLTSEQQHKQSSRVEQQPMQESGQ